jgi:nicotinamidase-related amidase
MKTLIVVDMQNDFIDGALANPAAAAIVKPMAEYIKNFDGQILFTRDTHYANYLETQEGKNLPIPHCILPTEGWRVHDRLLEAIEEKFNGHPLKEDWCFANKDSFGDISILAEQINDGTDEIYLCGTCTDICVISVALNLKARFPEIKMYCIADLCAGLTPEKHAAALEVMRSCQIEVI